MKQNIVLHATAPLFSTPADGQVTNILSQTQRCTF